MSSGFDLGGFSMIELFNTELQQHAASLSEGLLALEKGGVDDKRIESLMRAAHSIKGAARIVGLDPVVKLAHEMEDCFVGVQQNKLQIDAAAIDTLLRALDLLLQVGSVTEPQMDQWLREQTSVFDQMVAQVRSLATRTAAAAVVSPPAATEPTAAPIPAADAAPASTPSPPTPPSSSTLSAQPAVEPPSESVQPARPRASEPAREEKERAVRVSASHLDRMLGLSGELLVAAGWHPTFSKSLLQLKRQHARLMGQIEDLHHELSEQAPPADLADRLAQLQLAASESMRELTRRLEEFDDHALRSEDLAGRLHRQAVASRMRPFADGTQSFPRLVRDLARKLDKKVDFQIVGLDTQVDRDILEKLEAPLNHLLRNALDHGIESPAARSTRNKPESARLTLEARHHAGMLLITLTDDGRGIDPERIRRKVIDRKLTSLEMAQQLSSEELLDFLFLPGFSTAEQVTEISGRGVGLDVVHSMVQEVGGSVHCTSQLHQGATFHLELPITLSILRAMLVQIADQPYALPLARIERIVRVPLSQVRMIEKSQHFEFEDRLVSLVSARQVLQLAGQSPTSDQINVVMVRQRQDLYGLVVDRFLGEQDLVIRPLDPRLGKVPDLSAAAVLDDGTPTLIIDVDDMVRSIDALLHGDRLGRIDRSVNMAQQQTNQRILIVDDSFTVREVQRQLLSQRGYDVSVAVDGMDGWNAVRKDPYDLVITDVDMPRMNGIELVRAIKGDSRLKSIPVVIVSYKDREQDLLAGLDAGANYYLTKSSFHDQTLLKTVVDLIGEPQACASRS